MSGIDYEDGEVVELRHWKWKQWHPFTFDRRQLGFRSEGGVWVSLLVIVSRNTPWVVRKLSSPEGIPVEGWAKETDHVDNRTSP